MLAVMASHPFSLGAFSPSPSTSSLSSSSSSTPASPSPSNPNPAHKRPRGLWKGRRGSPESAPFPNPATRPHDPNHSPPLHPHPSALSDDCQFLHPRPLSRAASEREDYDDDDRYSTSSASSKRRRFSGPFDFDSHSPDRGHSVSSRRPSPSLRADFCPHLSSRPQHALGYPAPLPKISMSSSISAHGSSDHGSHSRTNSHSHSYSYSAYGISYGSNIGYKGKQSQQSALIADYEDWENLKELFASVCERYDADDTSAALPLLRAVIRECHRFLKAYPDPSIIYADPPLRHVHIHTSDSSHRHADSRSSSHLHTSSITSRSQSRSMQHTHNSRSPEAITPPDERLSRDWESEIDMDPEMDVHRKQERQPSSDPPAAFHAVFGITLFFMGTIIASDPTLALPSEPSEPSAYWLAALDVFETGENLPRRLAGDYSARESKSGGEAGSPFGSGPMGSAGFSDLQEDWRMAIVWGRTLVCLAEEKVAWSIRLAKEAQERSTHARPPPGSEDLNSNPNANANASSHDGPDSMDYSPSSLDAPYCVLPTSSPFSATEPAWPADSPFAAIAATRPPVSRRMSLYSASAHDVMVLAMDQFSRGIFHMPHPHSQAHGRHGGAGLYAHGNGNGNHGHASHSPHGNPRSTSPHGHGHGHGHGHSRPHAPLDPFASFSRPRELFTLASEVLGVAERLPDPTQRAYWAAWADSVFTQMRMEAELDAWRAPLMAARGRCWLVMGSARGEALEMALESRDCDAGGSAEMGLLGSDSSGDSTEEMLKSQEAEEARDGLQMAISFFERAKGASASGDDAEAEAEDVGPLLAEALCTLANLTVDENKREELYARAQAEAGDELGLELGLGLELERADDRMDVG